MRILSQNGMVDLPYESVGVSINHNDSTKIAAYPAGNYNKGFGSWEIARYSTAEKAQKAMEMLRDAFENYDWLKTTGNSDELKQAASILTHEQFKTMTASYFQFPTDDEIEV